VSNLLCGWLFGVRTHNESSYISAFILFFLFTPSLDVKRLAIFALIAFIASASKFILVFKGRHIFNPAAIAAVIISMTGLAFASWWVATPSLMPLTLVLAFLILYKTRRITMGLIFLGVATPIILVVFLSYGTDILTALPLLLSWPLLFFVGFMLCEPLTLPPKPWQQFVEAVIVGVCIAIPLHIGPFGMTPAVALIIGNIVAFVYARRRSLRLVYKESRQLTPTSHEFVFDGSSVQKFEPGQYVEMMIPHARRDGRGLRRSFSITSAPGSSTLTIGVKFYTPSSTFKAALRTLDAGTIIHATGINGDFVLSKDPTRPLLFVAGGIGITPFIGHLQYLKSIAQTRDIILIYAVGNIEEVAYKSLLKSMGIKVYIVSATPGRIDAKGWKVIGSPQVTKEIIEKIVPDISERIAYVSGPPFMVRGVKSHLKSLAAKRVKTDYFTGY